MLAKLHLQKLCFLVPSQLLPQQNQHSLGGVLDIGLPAAVNVDLAAHGAAGRSAGDADGAYWLEGRAAAGPGDAAGGQGYIAP